MCFIHGPKGERLDAWSINLSAKKLHDARVLVLGGAGFLGARIVRKLRHAGITPHVLLRPTSQTNRIDDLIQFCQIHIGDLSDLNSLQHIIKEVQPEVIFHAAGYGTHKAQNQREQLFYNNLLAAHNLLLATEQVPNCRIIYSGTSLEQGIKNKPIKENGVPDPVSFCGATKSAALLLMRQAACHDKRLITILTPFAVYGPGEPDTRLIPAAIQAGMEGKTLSLTEPGFVRDYVFVDDVADAYLMAATNDNAIGESINIAGGKAVSNEAVVALIEAELGRSIDKKPGAYPARKTDTSFWCADISKAKKILGWQAEHSMQQGIEETINWFKSHGFDG